MSSWQYLIKKWKKSHFLRFGLPLISLVVGGSFLTVDFQRIKYDAQRSKRDSKLLEDYGISAKVDLKEEYEKMAAATDVHQWRNIRGPRPYEDNEEFLSLREAQEKKVQQAMKLGEEMVQMKNQEKSVD